MDDIIDNNIKIRQLGMVDYLATWQKMKEFTHLRSAQTQDEIWLLQHPPIYTQGLAGKSEHLLSNNHIDVVKTDRGGQITYHGPGQIIAYLLLDMRRLKLGVRELVTRMENAVVDLLERHDIQAESRSDAPGVYVDNAKIAALGLKIKRGYCYHGIAFNVDMDLTPFSNINPCGYANLPVTQTKDLGINDSIESISNKLTTHLIKQIYRK